MNNLLSTDSLPYADFAEEYLELGYSPLPLPPGKKFPPPDGFTGKDAPTATADNVKRWVKECPDGNIGLRLPKGVIGIDVDAYKGQAELDAWQNFVERLGELPATARCSSRDDGISGIRLYRVPSDYVAKDLGLAGEVIQHHHRYVVAPPSIHPDTGMEYAWSDGMAWGVDELPELPQAWLDELRAGNGRLASGKCQNGPRTPHSMPSGYTNPDVPRLTAHGIPAGMSQETTLRDVAWKLAAKGTPRDEAEKTYRSIADKTKLSNPSWPWTAEDFARHYDRAVEKLHTEEQPEEVFNGELTDALLAEQFTDDILDGRYCWASTAAAHC